METFSKIQDLSDERAHLYTQLRRGKRIDKAQWRRLKPRECEVVAVRIRQFNSDLVKLWHIHRAELARINPDAMLHVDNYHSPWFADFIDRLRDGIKAQYNDIEEVPFIPSRQPTRHEMHLTDAAVALDEMRQAKREAWERAKLEEAKRQPEMPLHELLAKRGLTLRWEAGRNQAHIVRIAGG